jgi:hypothetical protein
MYLVIACANISLRALRYFTLIEETPLLCLSFRVWKNVVFNDFIDDELDSEDVSEQRASASLPDSVPIESEEVRAAREKDEAALDTVGDYEADPNVMLEDVPQDIAFKTLKVSCACVPVLVFVCVCVCVRARDVDMCS